MKFAAQMVDDRSSRTTLVRHASDFDLLDDELSSRIQALGSWTSRIVLQPDCRHNKPDDRTFRFQKSDCSKQSVLDKSPESSHWNQQFRQKWRQEQLRARRGGVDNSPDDLSGSSGIPDVEQRDDFVFGIDDVDGAEASDHIEAPSVAAADTAVVDHAAANMIPFFRQQLQAAQYAATLQAMRLKPAAVSVSQPITIASRLPHTALQQQLQQHQQRPHNQQQAQQLEQWQFKGQQHQHQIYQQHQQRQVPHASTEHHSAAAAPSSPTSDSESATSSLHLRATNTKASSDIGTNRSSDSEGSLKNAFSSLMVPETAAMLEAAGLPPIRRVTMRGNSGKLKAQVRMYKADLPPQHYRASQAA